MANSFEQIAENKKNAALAKQQEDVSRFADKVADQVLANVTLANETHRGELETIISELSTAVAGTIVLSNEKIDLQLKDNFSELLIAVQNSNIGDNVSKLNKDIGLSLAKLETAFDKIELSPQITLNSVTQEQLQSEIDKILARLPEGSQREVTLAYEKASADKYINVRLTDGISFYKATGGGSGGGTNISAIKGFALGEYDRIDTTYPTSSSEQYTYSLAGTTTFSILVTYTDSTKANILSVVKS